MRGTGCWLDNEERKSRRIGKLGRKGDRKEGMVGMKRGS